MITVLIADDNKLSLQYFSQIISWEEYGFQLVSTAVDGENAWYDFQKYHPQVVIADIQMPVLSGIELAKKVLNAAPETVFILLSSYKEFQYAHAALQLKVYDYLLKHETTKDLLIQKLEGVKSYIASEKEKNFLLLKDILYRLFIQPGSSSDNTFSIPHSLSGSFDCYFLEHGNTLPFIRRLLPNLEEKEPSFSREELVEYCKKLEHTVTMIPVSADQYLLLTAVSPNPMESGYMLQNLLNARFKTIFSIVILKKSDTLANCAAAYHELKPFLEKLHFYPDSAVLEGIYLQSASLPSRVPSPEKSDFIISQKTLEELDRQYEQIALSMDYEAFCRYAEIWINKLLRYDRHLIHPKTGEILSLFAADSAICGRSVSSVFQWIRVKYTELTDILTMNGFFEYSPLTDRTVYLISENYQNDFLSVDWLTEQMKVSTSNLNLLFKKETGFTPWKVIIIARLSKARKLLEQDLPITRISALTGYNSLSYFSRSFKKMYGVTPEEYRRSNGC